MPIDLPADTDALLHLVLAGGAPEPRHGLLTAHGSAAAALRAGPNAWRAAGCSGEQRTRLLRPDPDALSRGRQWLAQPGRHLLSIDADDYPDLLRSVARAPLALFVHGDPTALWHPGVAVVGSRTPSPTGAELAAEFADAFARSGLAVFSGLAAGIDGRAHHAALAVPGGRTVAVVGTGPDRVFPPRHDRLQAQIAERGAVVSEYPPGTEARAGQFPARNRIVAGLSLGTVVIEAALRSGALITARLAAESGREVFALPGSVRNPRARGCHRLIRDGVRLVEHPDEIIEPLGAVAARLGQALRTRLNAPTEQARPTPPGSTFRSDPDYQRLWQALDENPIPMDSLVLRSGLTAARLSAMLQLMELDGKVVAVHGCYCRKP
ncbi:DNA-processing protein DprA [Stenotrophomonas sp. PS02289]|uniref:DNA-processing protein DprA n=1 Tax=Stenotrophomonas sp. PS02289 TaxID=2991422 RepID=UPI00249C174D|nr:DNA-processing protein DprA [Stenotrophomonas sp. PS02289]